MPEAIADIAQIDGDLGAYLRSAGEVFTVFGNQDSRCVSYGVEAEGRRWFVKHSNHPDGIASLHQAVAILSVVKHPTLTQLHHTIACGGGFALVYDWVDGESLYRGDGHRDRFLRLPVANILEALNNLYEIHDRVAAQGFIAVDLYDGSFMYDFDNHRFYVLDLDLYEPGPFTLQADRNFGSTRYMAPKEFDKGSWIDEITNVFTLGRVAFELMSDGSTERVPWRMGDATFEVVRKAVEPDRAHRFPSEAAFCGAWRDAVVQEAAA